MEGNECTFPTGDHNNIQPEYGLSKREYMATQIFSALINSIISIEISDEDKCTCALYAVEYADALIKALNQKKQ